MAVPNRPASGAVVETAWGQVVHDGIVAMDIQSGTAVAPASGTATSQIVVPFPRPFAAIPTVIANVATANRLYAVGAGATTPTQTVLTVGHVDNVAIGSVVALTWIAYGPRA